MAQRGGGAIRDEAMAYKRAALFLPASIGGGGFSTTDGITQSEGAGAAILVAMQADCQLLGLSMAADNDECHWGVDIKTQMQDFNLAYNLHAQVIYTHTSTDADTGISWKVDVKGVIKPEALSAAGTSPDGTVTLANDTASTTADSLEVTSEGALITAGDFGSEEDGDLDDFLMVKCTCLDLGASTSADELKLIGVRLFGTRSMSHHTARAQTT